MKRTFTRHSVDLGKVYRVYQIKDPETGLPIYTGLSGEKDIRERIWKHATPIRNQRRTAAAFGLWKIFADGVIDIDEDVEIISEGTFEEMSRLEDYLIQTETHRRYPGGLNTNSDNMFVRTS